MELVGHRVRVHSLMSRSECNGRHGDVISFDPAAGRAGVQLDELERPLALKLANLEAIEAPALVCPHSADAKSLARFVASHSIQASEPTRRSFASEARTGEALGGRWCCRSSSLWCIACAGNLAYSGVDEEVADNIPTLLGLRRQAFSGPRKLAGELESAVHLVERVATFRKPMGQVVLDNLSDEERSFLHQEIIRHRTITSKRYVNAWGMSMLGFCVRDRRLSSIADFSRVAQLYLRAELKNVSRQIEESFDLGMTPISEWLSTFDVEENGRKGWLTGLLMGYPLWTTIARYHNGGFDEK